MTVTSTSLRHTAALFRALYWGPARAAFRVVGPSYALLGMVAGLVFGGQGLHPRTLIAWMFETGWALVLFWAGWWLFSGRGHRAALADPALAWLRTFPEPHFGWLLATLPWLLLLEAPWLLLWGFGAPDWRCSVGVLGSAFGITLHRQTLALRRVRRPSQRRVWLESTSALSRGLRRRSPFALVLLGAGWSLATALCLVMGKRPTEPLAVQVEFAATTLALMTLVCAASLRWLLHDELRKLEWLWSSSATGLAALVAAELLTVVAHTGFALGMVVTAIGFELPSLGLRLLAHLFPNLTLACAASASVPLLARGRNPSRAPVYVVLALSSYLFAVHLTSAPWQHATLFGLATALAVGYRARGLAERKPGRSFT